MRGLVENGSHAFRGIPYAEPPVGDLRFRPPVPRARWDGIRDCFEFGDHHIQEFDGVESIMRRGERRPPGADDCLNLNVWTPGEEAAGLPVLVWIHGGSLRFGTGADPVYDGSTFARDGVVCVTLNYRLYPAGFLNVRGRPGAGAFGLLDQTAALRWVRENIAAFGGDPQQVTVAGESAGAHSIGQLLAAPAARGLFQRAILQSGSCIYAVPDEVSAALGDEVLAAVGVDPDDDAALAAIDGDALLSAATRAGPRVLEILEKRGIEPPLFVAGTGTDCASTYGTDVVPERAIDVIRAGGAAGVDLMVGTTADEVNLFGPDFPSLAPIAAAAAFSGRAEEVLRTYADARPGQSQSEVWAAFMTDLMFRIGATQLLEAAEPHHANIYSYVLAYGSGQGMGALHGLDLPLMWGGDPRWAEPFFEASGNEPAPDLTRQMHGAWVEFIKTGVPRAEGLPDWPRYELGRRASMVFDRESRIAEDFQATERLLWEGVEY